MVKDIPEILGILIILVEIYRFIRRYWLCRPLEKKKKEKPSRKSAVLRPKSERDCRFCWEGKGKRITSKRDFARWY